MSRRGLIDTGPLVALRSPKDQHRKRVVELLPQVPEALYTCWPVLTEVAHFLKADPTQFPRLLSSVQSGKIQLLEFTTADIAPIKQLLTQYADSDLDFADARLIHLANREGIKEIFTVDPDDFRFYKGPGGQTITVIA